MGLLLLSVAFPGVRHVKFPDWHMQLGTDVVGWKGVRILELGTRGLPYTWGPRVFSEALVRKAQAFNWPDLETLIISGTCTDGSINLFTSEYIAFVDPKRGFMNLNLSMLVIEHPVAHMMRETFFYSYITPKIWTVDTDQWQELSNCSEVQTGGWA